MDVFSGEKCIFNLFDFFPFVFPIKTFNILAKSKCWSKYSNVLAITQELLTTYCEHLLDFLMHFTRAVMREAPR